jgi:hypothetical protein
MNNENPDEGWLRPLKGGGLRSNAVADIAGMME